MKEARGGQEAWKVVVLDIEALLDTSGADMEIGRLMRIRNVE